MQGARWLTGIGVSSDVDNDNTLKTTEPLTKSPFSGRGLSKNLVAGTGFEPMTFGL